jgi:type II secretory pathway component PulM
MRALWAERQARPRNAEDQRRQQRQDRRNSILYGVLWLGLVSLVIGGYVSLLGPVRQRLASQAAQIQELIRERDQLRHANQQLAVQVETLTAPLQR